MEPTCELIITSSPGLASLEQGSCVITEKTPACSPAERENCKAPEKLRRLSGCQNSKSEMQRGELWKARSMEPSATAHMTHGYRVLRPPLRREVLWCASERTVHMGCCCMPEPGPRHGMATHSVPRRNVRHLCLGYSMECSRNSAAQCKTCPWNSCI